MRQLCLALVLLCATPVLAHAASADDVLAANRDAALIGSPPTGDLVASYVLTGNGLTGEARSQTDLTRGDFVETFALGPQQGAKGFDGKTAWMRDPSGAVTPQDGGDKRQLAVNEAYRRANLWWRPGHAGAGVRMLGQKTEAGGTYDVLQVTPAGGKPFLALFDARTHLLAATREAQGAIILLTRYDDYRAVGGLMVAGRIVANAGLGPTALMTQILREARIGPARPRAAYAAPRLPPTDAQIRNPAGRVTVPFKLINNHIYAPVTVNGRGPYLFIFDTGGHSVLMPETAQGLGLRSEAQGTGSGAGEGVVKVGFLTGVTFEIGDLILKDQSAAVMTFASVANEGVPEQGMLGFELFRRFVTVIDYGASTLTFIAPERFDPKDAGTAVPFAFYDHLPQVKGTFEGVPAVFNIDTGSRVELTLTKPFVDGSGLRASHPKGVMAVDGWGVGGRSISYVTRAREVSLGSVIVPDVVVGMATQSRGAFSDPNYHGNIGSGFLKRFVVTFDYDRQRMYLKRLADPGPDVGVFDRSGMWINAAGNGFSIVDVTPGGPAEAAGLVAGDEITAVDGRPATGLLLPDLRARLRSPGLRELSLTVRRGGQERAVILALRDQI